MNVKEYFCRDEHMERRFKKNEPGHIVQKLTCLPVFNKKEFLDIIYYGLSQRTTKKTGNNVDSSRGHVFIIIKIINLTETSTKVSQIVTMDLAGVEKLDDVTKVTTDESTKKALTK